MAEAFNPYREWLGLETARPNYYELLSVPVFESDIEAIVVAADRAATRVRSFRPGVNAAAWSRLLDEIHTAKECLLNDNDKVEYDRRLRASGPANSPAQRKEMTREPAPATDDRYPPGMGPATGRAKTETRETAAPAAPRPEAWPPAPATAPAAAPLSAAAPPQGTPGSYAQPAGNATAPYAAPAQYPAAYPYPAPTPYALPPGAAPYAAPQAPYPAPMAMPMAYPAAGAYGGYPAAIPMANPYGAMAHPYGMPGGYPAAYPPAGAPQSPPPAPPPTVNEPVALAGGYSPPMSFDPMAPVAIPGMGTPSGALPSPRVVGFAGAVGELPPGAKQAIPMGTAVAAGGAVPMRTAVGSAGSTATSPASPTDSADPIGAVRRSSSASAAVMAAQRGKQSNHMLLLVGAGGALVLAAAVAIVVVMNMGRDPVDLAQVTPAADSNPTAGPQAMPRGVESTIPTTPPVRPTPAEPQPKPPVEPMPAPTPMPEPMTPAPMPEPAVPTPMPAPAPTPTPEPTPPPAPAPPPTPPTPAPVAEPAPPLITKQEAIALGKALTTAKIALGEQNFDEADKQLALAEPLAKLPNHQAKYQRLKEVADYVKQFRGAVAEAVAGLEAGATFKVGTSTMVVVVETFPDKIIIRSLGQNKTYPFQDLPVGLAVAIADMKLDTAAPANRVIKGAYLAVDKRGDSVALDKAKAFWEEAQLGGIDTSHLLPFLSDKYDELERDIPAQGAKQPPASTGEAKPGE